MANFRDVAQHAGVSLATASRVASGSLGRPGRDAGPRRGGDARAPLRRARRGRHDGRDRPARARARRTRSSPRSPRRWSAARPLRAWPRSSATPPARRRARPSTSACCSSARSNGMIFISSEVTYLRSDHEHYRRLLRAGARLVFVNGGSAQLDVTSVGVDERAAGRLATEHLLELGHTRIGFAAGDALSSPTQREGRRDGRRRCTLPGSSRTVSSPTRSSPSRAAGWLLGSCSRIRAGRRPGSSARTT